MKASPFTTTIELDLYVWERWRAQAVLEQLVAELEKQHTNDQGGMTLHHRVTAVTLRANPNEGRTR